MSKDKPVTREEVKDIVADTAKVIMEFVRKENQETRVHFDAVAETIHQDLSGANKDEIAGIQNTQNNHEDRITNLEERAGAR